MITFGKSGLSSQSTNSRRSLLYVDINYFTGGTWSNTAYTYNVSGYTVDSSANGSVLTNFYCNTGVTLQVLLTGDTIVQSWMSGSTLVVDTIPTGTTTGVTFILTGTTISEIQNVTTGETFETYPWAVYIPNGADINSYLTTNSKVYENDIIRKEAEWAALEPKTRTILGPNGSPIQVPILKSEIVKPTIPDSEEMLSDTLLNLDSIKRLLSLLTNDLISHTGITQQHINDLTVINDCYKIDTAYKTGAVFSFDLKLWEVVQGHTSQADWYPPTTPALYKLKTPAGTVVEWIQPLGAQDAYQIDDKVLHNGFTWISTVNDNVWEPGVYGWNQL